MPNQVLLTTAEAAQRLGVSARTASRLVASGALTAAQKLPGLRGAFLFDEVDVEQLKADRVEALAAAGAER